MIFNEGHAVMSGAGTLLPGHAVNGASILADEPEPFTASWLTNEVSSWVMQ